MRTVTFITHPDVVIDPAVPVPRWPLSERGRQRMRQMLAHPWVSDIGSVYCSTEQKAIDGAAILSAHLSLDYAMVEALGEERARVFHSPASFMHFQIVNFDKIPLNVTYLPSSDLIKSGDYVELLAHDDVYVFISPCCLGDQNDTSDLEKCVNWPFKVSIFEGEAVPLETAPDPKLKTMEPFEYVKAGRPGMVTGKVGKK